MYKKIIAAVLVAAAVIGAIFIAIPKSTEESPPHDEGLTIGVENISGNFSPFFSASEGDKYVRDAVLSSLTVRERDTTKSASDSVPSVAESFRIFFADRDFAETPSYSDGGFTAASYVIKDSLYDSAGNRFTVEDVVFSLYALLDPLSEGDKSAFATLAGYDDFTYGIDGISELMEKARTIMSKDVGATPAAGDGYTEEEARDMRAALTESGTKYAERIRDFVLEKYCEEEMTSSYIFDGVTPNDVTSSEALSNAYAVRMWNYGNFTYDYTENPEGAYVCTTDADGKIQFKATYEAALEDESYADYVRDDEYGEYYYDYQSREYVKIGEDDEVLERYSRVLSDKYVRANRSALSGFRDIEGNFYTLEGDSFPTMETFFELMKNTYTTDAGFDYKAMERVESADDFSFSKDAVEAFAKSHASGGTVTNISGVRVSEQDGKSVVTLYFEGNDYFAAYDADLYIVSKSACLDGFDAGGAELNDAGFPTSSEEFFAHLKEISSSPVSAGPYKVNTFEDGAVYLDANYYFISFGDGVDNPIEANVTFKDISASDAAGARSAGEVMIDMSLITKDEVAEAGDDVDVIYYPNASYKYILINPAYYKNYEARLAIASVIDPSSLASDGTDAISRSIPTFFDSYAGDGASSFDASGQSAAAHFEEAGYKLDKDGNLIDPSTKEKANFKFYLLPEEKGGACEAMITRAIDILRSLGADGEVVFDADLKTRVYSDETVPIYVLGWEVGRGLSMYERYAYTSGSDAVKGCGIDKLYTIGQLDALGKLSYKGVDGEAKQTTQSDAVEELDNAIKASLATIDRESRNSLLFTAEELISSLTFEIPLCEYESVCLVQCDLVDVTSLTGDATSERGPIAEIWKIKLLGE